jgi:hypothetical protein
MYKVASRPCRCDRNLFGLLYRRLFHFAEFNNKANYIQARFASKPKLPVCFWHENKEIPTMAEANLQQVIQAKQPPLV